MKRLLSLLLIVAIVTLAGASVFGAANTAGKKCTAANISKSEFAVMLHKALDIKVMYFKAPDITEIFSDVKNDASYAGALNDLATLGIIDDKGQFKPTALLTREIMVHYIVNAYRYKMNISEISIQGIKIKISFKDESKITARYMNDIRLAVGLGLIKGKCNKMFGPKDLATRKEAETVIDRLVKLLASEKPAEQTADVKIISGFEKGDVVSKMKLSITNNSAAAVTIHHNSGMKYDFVLLDSEKKELYRWSEGKFFVQAFVMGLNDTVIEPGTAREFVEELDMAEFGDAAGKAHYLTAYIKGVSDEFKVNPDGYEFKIK